MHTLKVIFGGILLLGVCQLVGRWIGGAAATVDATTIKYFLVLWVVATLANAACSKQQEDGLSGWRASHCFSPGSAEHAGQLP